MRTVLFIETRTVRFNKTRKFQLVEWRETILHVTKGDNGFCKKDRVVSKDCFSKKEKKPRSNINNHKSNLQKITTQTSSKDFQTV